MPNAAPWTPDEGVFLCRAYTNVSEDGGTSTDQSSSLFWDRVLQTFLLFSRPGGTSRQTGALQSRWSSLIRPDVALYASCFASAKSEERSGWTDEDYVTEAKNRFASKREQQNENALSEYEEGVRKGTEKKKRKPRVKSELFRLDHCYDVLRESIRFMRDVPQPRKRQRLSLSSVAGSSDMQSESPEDQAGGGDTTRHADEDAFDFGDVLLSPAPSPISTRPNSAGKKKMKQLQFEEQVDKAMMHSQRELTRATRAQVEIMQKKLEVAQKKIFILETQQQTLNEQADMAVMCASTEGLSELGREYLLIKQKQVLDKIKKHTS